MAWFGWLQNLGSGFVSLAVATAGAALLAACRLDELKAAADDHCVAEATVSAPGILFYPPTSSSRGIIVAALTVASLMLLCFLKFLLFRVTPTSKLMLPDLVVTAQ